MANINLDVVACVKWVYEETKFIPCAYWNKKKLKKEMGRLNAMRRDVTTIIEQQERTHLGTKCKVVVRSWLDRVNDTHEEVTGLLNSLRRISSCSCCFAAFHPKKLLELIDDVHSLVEEGRNYVDDKILVYPVPMNHKKNLERRMEDLRRMQEVVNKIIQKQEREQPWTECKIAVRSWLDAVVRKDEEVNVILDPIAEETSISADVNVADLVDSIQSLVEEGKKYMDDNHLVQQILENPTVNHKNKMERKMEELKKMQEVVIKIISRQERQQPGTECKDAVRSWLDDVNHNDEEVNAILHSDAESSNWAENIEKLLGTIEFLVEQGRRHLESRESLVCTIPDNPVDNVPDLPTPMVGRNLKLLQINDYLGDDQVKTIGIWGPGGIGKTTLLKSIKDGLSTNRDFFFFYIVWIEMSSQNDVDILKIQKQIAKCISLTLSPEQDESERARTLRKALRHKKTLLLIDNVWNELEFERIGVPFSVGNDLLKIVLTTRFERVCTDMRTQKIVKLDYLDKEESLQLFQNNISSDHVDLKNQMVRQRVDEILQKCGGLPLAILTVARTVANYTRVEEWDDAVECLRNSPAEMEGMDDVMKCLKFSYDKLESNEIRSCLLYFSLYLEGWNIRIHELIKVRLAEGFVDLPKKNSFRKSYARGLVFLNKLKSFRLVESGIFDKYDVKVHDVIREMLCWISKNEKREVLLVCNKDHEDVSNYKDWHLTKGIHLNELQLKCSPHENGLSLCPNLTTLFVEPNPSHPIGKLPTEDFFHFTPSLRVLDLSCIGLVELPKSIGELGELRYLNLNRAPIKMLPVEFGNLKKLKCLDLGHTPELESIPNVAISQLSMLQSLNLFNTKYQWNSDVNCVPPHLLMLEDLTKLKNLEDLGVDVSSNSHLNTILGNQILFNSITRLRFGKIDFVEENLQPIKVITERFPRAKYLLVDQCVLPDNVLEIKDNHPLIVEILNLRNLDISSVVIVKDGCHPFRSLISLRIIRCRCLKEASWTAQLPSLQVLDVENCNGVEELLATGEKEMEEEEEGEYCYFPKIIHLNIIDMKNLHSIYGRNRPLLFPSLKALTIQNCPKLKQLPLGRDSAKGIQIIKCTQSQWNSLEWEDGQVQERFLPYLRVPLQ